MTLEEKIMTRKRFSKAVEELVAEKKLDYLDAMAYVVKKRGLDIRNVPKLLTPSLKEKLTAQVSKANLIRDKKTNKLPIWYIIQWDQHHTARAEDGFVGGWNGRGDYERPIWGI